MFFLQKVQKRALKKALLREWNLYVVFGWFGGDNLRLDKGQVRVRVPNTVSLMQLRLSHGKSQSIWQKPTTWQKSECLGFVIGWPLPVYSGKTQGGYKK